MVTDRDPDIGQQNDSRWHTERAEPVSPFLPIFPSPYQSSIRLDLQRDSKALGPHSTDIQRVKILDRTSRLRRQIDAWIEVQRVYMPEVSGIRDQQDQTEGSDCLMAWNIDLLLPSKLLAEHKVSCDNRLLNYEWELRLAQVSEALATVRRKILLETYVFNHKEVYTQGQKAGTASNALLANCRREKTWSIATYNRAREALKRLAKPLGKDGWASTWKVLDPQDAVPIAGYGKKKKREAGKKDTSGESHRQLSWIWLTPGAVDGSTEEGLQDGEIYNIFGFPILRTTTLYSLTHRVV